MQLLTNTLVGLVAVLHLYFLYLEMFQWTKPKGLKIFGQTLEQAQTSAVLAANQGLYNGFLAAGLIWGLAHPSAAFGAQIKIFFLSCVIVAGVYGAVTVGRKILFVQALPAAFALILESILRILSWTSLAACPSSFSISHLSLPTACNITGNTRRYHVEIFALIHPDRDPLGLHLSRNQQSQ